VALKYKNIKNDHEKKNIIKLFLIAFVASVFLGSALGKNCGKKGIMFEILNFITHR
jgi:hypothetical protein